MQVLVDEAEWKEIRRTARSQRLTVAEWVRQTLRSARQARSSRDSHEKIAAIRAAMKFAHPTADLDQMNAEIERGYLDPAQS